MNAQDIMFTRDEGKVVITLEKKDTKTAVKEKTDLCTAVQGAFAERKS